MYTILKKEALNPTVTRMDIAAPLIARKAEPGQFVILRVDEAGERIPLTVADTDPEAGSVTIIFQIVGATTYKLNQLQVGDSLHDFVGPLGVASHVEGLKKVAVIGGGVGSAIAYPIAKKLHALGATVIGIDGIEERLALGKKMGCDAVVDFRKENVVEQLKAFTGGAGPDRIYESSGSMVAQRQALEAAAVHGQICMVGFNGPMSQKADAAPSLYTAISKELTLFGSSIMPRQDHFAILDLIRKKHVDLEAMITHRFPFAQIQEAVRLFDTGKTGKIVIDF